jgi:hypothetical protein
MDAIRPYSKAIAAGICAAVMMAATYYDYPPLAIVAAFCTPISVFLARNAAMPAPVDGDVPPMGSDL